MYCWMLLLQKDRYKHEQKIIKREKLKRTKIIKVWENKKVIKEVKVEY